MTQLAETSEAAIPETMRAARFHTRGDLRIERVPAPRIEDLGYLANVVIGGEVSAVKTGGRSSQCRRSPATTT